MNIFNDVNVAEEIYKSEIPVVTGIGHETDRTLADYVADIYCHTPTAAAERIISGYKDIEEKLRSLKYTLQYTTLNKLMIMQAELKSDRYILKSSLPIEKIFKYKNDAENYRSIIADHTTAALTDTSHKLEMLMEKLKGYNYSNHLKNGFALVSDRNGNIVRSLEHVHANEVIDIRFKDFKIQAEILSAEEVK